MDTEVLVREQAVHRLPAWPKKLRGAHALSVVVAVISAASSIIGLLFPTIYISKDWAGGTSRGNDLVTLLIAVPILALSVFYSARGSVRGRLLWLGSLYFLFYNYAFYVFGLPVTKLFLPIIAAFALSGLALIVGLVNLDLDVVARSFAPRTPVKPIAVYLFLAGTMVSFLWVSQWIRFLQTGRVPEVNGSPAAYQVITAVDLGFMVPALILAGWLLWRRRPWGYVLGVMLNLQGGTYNAVMATVCVFGWKLNGGQLFSGWFINCIVGVTVCSLCLAGLLLNVESKRRPDE